MILASASSGDPAPVADLDGGEAGGPRPLEDPLALEEIELYGEVVIAASESDHPLGADELDRVLGVDAGCGGQPKRPEM